MSGASRALAGRSKPSIHAWCGWAALRCDGVACILGVCVCSLFQLVGLRPGFGPPSTVNCFI
eukprot:scaffold2986_cov123-Isochrysis_galbana.AAC.4